MNTTPSAPPLNARVTLYADCPPSFEESVNGLMPYEDNGAQGFFILKAWLLECNPEFIGTSLHSQLIALFAAFPGHEEAILCVD